MGPEIPSPDQPQEPTPIEVDPGREREEINLDPERGNPDKREDPN